MNEKYENKNQPEKNKNSKEQERMGFLEYLQKSQKEKKERQNKGKVIIGVEGTPIKTTTKANSIVESETVNPSIEAVEYARVFKKAVEEEKEEKNKHKEEEERE